MSKTKKIVIKTGLKSGGFPSFNHNQKRAKLVVKSGLKAGGFPSFNHNQIVR